MTTLVGLELKTATALLAARGISAEKISVRETAPPRPEKATGTWRVLRCRVSEEGVCEIVAAREQLREPTV